MMRELGTVSPVVWPAWCYSGEGQADSDIATEQQASAAPAVAAIPATKQRGKKRQQQAATMNGSTTSITASEAANNNNNIVKSERLSPSSGSAANIPDNNSSSSRSATPSSSYPGTPPGLSSDRGSSPSTSVQSKSMDQLMNRNYSDFMRSLAAKYNNANPNDYFSAPPRNGFSVALDPRFSPFKTETTPFVGLMTPLVATTSPSSVLKTSTSTSTSTSTTVTAKDSYDCSDKKPSLETQQQALYASFAPFTQGSSPMFSPLIDMSSTQALLNMVRTANAHNASQLENYLKATNKKVTTSENSPLDLSSASLPTYGKKMRLSGKSLSDSLYSGSAESLLHIPMVDALRATQSTTITKAKRFGSVSPKPPSRTGSSPRLTAPATVTSAHSRNLPCLSVCGVDRPCSASQDAQAIGNWTVDDVCSFVSSIENCAEYSQNFREQRIDGSALPLLTEEHLTSTLSMKLGPALKLRATLARRLGHCAICMHCVHCHNLGSGPPTLSPALTPPSGRPSSTGT